MWLLGLGRHGLRGSRRHFRLQWRRTCLTVWWTSAPFLLLRLALIPAPNPEKPEWENVCNEGIKVNNKQNKAINNARKRSWQGKERLREKSNGKTLERLLFCSIVLKVRRTYVHPEWSTHSTLEFLASQNSPPNAHTHKRVTVFRRMELILFCSRMTCCRLDGSQRFPVGWIPTGIFETASRYFYNLFLRRTLAFRTLIMLVTYLTHS